MGCCVSSSTTSPTPASATSPPAAIVISVDSSLTEYSIPATVSEVLGIDHLASFLCSSDSLRFDAPVRRLHSSYLLEQDQIYFVLPRSKLGRVLSGPDMAALAARASSALNSLGPERRKECIASPRLEASNGDHVNTVMARRRSGGEKLGRGASAWAKAVRRSLRKTLSNVLEEIDDDQ